MLLKLIQNNINICPKTKINILWHNITNGIKISDNDFNYLAELQIISMKRFKIKKISKIEYIENGCWFIDKYYSNKYWYKFGKLHRDDGPAIEWSNGIKSYFQNGLRHKLDGPAIDRPNGTKEYYQYGKRHRESGPAIEYSDGTKEYWQNGKRCG